MLKSPPKFWDHQNSLLAMVLTPMSWLYRAASRVDRCLQKTHQIPVPVISVGNVVMGGAGKTPTVLALAEILQKIGHNPHVITRGYGGALTGPVLVNPENHSFRDVGDEPLLLARQLPTWVAKNRWLGAQCAVKAGADCILLDDAHQNNSLAKDLSFVVVNSVQKFGNGFVFPAGPLRESVKSGLDRATALIFIGENTDEVPQEMMEAKCPVLHAALNPLTSKGGTVVAFAGLGYPEKFRQTLLKMGYHIKDFVSFSDHHPYTEKDLQILNSLAQQHNANLMTTAKDEVRIPVALKHNIEVLEVKLMFQDEKRVEDLLSRLWEKNEKV